MILWRAQLYDVVTPAEAAELRSGLGARQEVAVRRLRRLEPEVERAARRRWDGPQRSGSGFYVSHARGNAEPWGRMTRATFKPLYRNLSP